MIYMSRCKYLVQNLIRKFRVKVMESKDKGKAVSIWVTKKYIGV